MANVVRVACDQQYINARYTAADGCTEARIPAARSCARHLRAAALTESSVIVMVSIDTCSTKCSRRLAQRR